MCAFPMVPSVRSNPNCQLPNPPSSVRSPHSPLRQRSPKNRWNRPAAAASARANRIALRALSISLTSTTYRSVTSAAYPTFSAPPPPGGARDRKERSRRGGVGTSPAASMPPSLFNSFIKARHYDIYAVHFRLVQFNWACVPTPSPSDEDRCKSSISKMFFFS